MIKAVRGTRDILPPDSALFEFVEERAREVFHLYNFQEIRTPIFEDTQLFSRSVGEETDIVGKEMFTWYEDNTSPELLMYQQWIQRFREEFDSFEPESSKRGADILAYKGSQPWLIELKAQLRGNPIRVIEKLRADGRAWVASRPGSNPPTLALAIPAAEQYKFRNVDFGDVHLQTLPGSLEEPRSLTLRPENTAGVVRAYIEHKLGDSGQLQKLYYMGPQFRRERIQKGRYRQFYQIGAEVIGPPSAGSESPARDAEVIEMLATLLDRVGIKGWTLQLNSVGCANDRAKYNDALRAALKDVVGQMCVDCQRRAETNPLRVLDCKVPEDQPIIEKLPKISDYLGEPSRQHFAEVKKILDAVGVKYEINERMVRGLDYYTRTTFEFTHGGLGAQSALLGGGRYDGLSEALGGPKAPGIGFALGLDRFVLALQSETEAAKASESISAYIAPLGSGTNASAAQLARELRAQGVALDLGDESFRLKKSFEAAERAGAKFVIIVGENEVKSDAFAVKDIKSGEQRIIERAELATVLGAK